MSLTQDQEDCLKLASGNEIINRFSALKKNFASVEWLKPDNKFRNDPGGVLNALDHNTVFVDQQLVDYMAASIPRNCFDAWVYLGSAIRCIINGELWQARHLAYYAELRAAFAILASEGIGVFNNRHVIIDDKGQCHPFPANVQTQKRHGTHLFVWDAMEFWSKGSQGLKLFGSQIIAYGFSLNEWMDKFPIPHSNVTGYQLLNEWGLDLKTLAKDRELRNQVSYCPEFRTQCEYQTAEEISQILSSFWSLAEPTSQTFTDLDKFIVKVSLQKRHIHTGAKRSYSDAINIMVDKLFPQDLGNQGNLEYKNFFTNSSLPDVLKAASGNSAITAKGQHFEVMSRAFLLLRLACASSNHLMKKSGIKASDIQSWWEYEGLKRGLWKYDDVPEPLTDMWGEVYVALDDINGWVQEHATDSSKPCILSLHETQAKYLISLAKFERMALWAIPQ